jgi:hypothetical protein
LGKPFHFDANNFVDIDCFINQTLLETIVLRSSETVLVFLFYLGILSSFNYFYDPLDLQEDDYAKLSLTLDNIILILGVEESDINQIN